MMPIPLLAHAAFGIWDEVLFIGIAIIFTGLLIYSWWKSRSFEAELDEVESADAPQSL